MHREVMGAQTGEVVDHLNGDPSDNRRSNLRLTTQSSNNCNRRTAKGYDYDARNKHKPWIARFKRKFIGAFATESEAKAAYLAARQQEINPYN